MATQSPLIITELDFNEIKQNLINYMQGQTIFSDYNFTGSGLQALLDILAYNVHYSAYLVNMVANEMHLPTAVVRDNINNLAKSLNYVPSSATSPSASVNILASNSPPYNSAAASTLLLPRYTSFLSQSIGGINYNYVTTQAYIAPLVTTSNGSIITSQTYSFNNVIIQEGDVINYTYSVDATNPRSTFNIPNANIDTSTLIVNVTENTPSPSQTNPYILCADVSLLDGNSRVYFLEGAQDSTYNIYFGDGILGRNLTAGDSVNLIYLNTNADLSNSANAFTIMGPLGTASNVIVQTTAASGGGGQAETNDSIKTNAPLAYTTQERAVTLDDYNFLLLRDYPNISSIASWGGDTNIPPVFGTIFISVKPIFGQYLTAVQQQVILNVLQKYKMPTIQIAIVNPDYTYILVETDVNYNVNVTSSTSAQLISTIQAVIINFCNTQLSKFNRTYRDSSMDQAIIGADPSILGTDTNIFLQKRFFPILGTNATYTLNYNTPLLRGGLFESLYSSPGILINDSNGIARTCFIEENINTYQGITDIVVNNPGINYTGIPIVTIIGDGTGATAHADIVNGIVNNIVLDVAGQGYSFATVSITGGGGFGATATPVLAAATGILQTYYTDGVNKFFITQNQGIVDHVNGIVTLTNFNPIDIANLTKSLSISIKPQNGIIFSARNNILILDPTDPTAIQVSLIPQVGN